MRSGWVLTTNSTNLGQPKAHTEFTLALLFGTSSPASIVVTTLHTCRSTLTNLPIMLWSSVSAVGALATYGSFLQGMNNSVSVHILCTPQSVAHIRTQSHPPGGMFTPLLRAAFKRRWSLVICRTNRSKSLLCVITMHFQTNVFPGFHLNWVYSKLRQRLRKSKSKQKPPHFQVCE